MNYYETMSIQELRKCYSWMMFKKLKHKFKDSDIIDLDLIKKALNSKSSDRREVYDPYVK